MRLRATDVDEISNAGFKALARELAQARVKKPGFLTTIVDRIQAVSSQR